MKIVSKLLVVLAVVACTVAAGCENVIEVAVPEGDATEVLRAAIDEAAAFDGSPVTIRLEAGDYHISRTHAARHVYYVSNTASAQENPDPTKHIGIWLKRLRNVVIDGNGAQFVTHGEMTPIVIDSCVNVSLKNFLLTAADPSVPEFKVVAVDSISMTVEITAPSRFEIADGRFYFVGEDWRFPDERYPRLAQVFYPEENVTLRCDSPIEDYSEAYTVGDNLVRFVYNSVPDVRTGEIYQFRHGIRSEVCGFINGSRDVRIENAEFNFLGNFGLVGQFSENITYDNIRCRPDAGTERTNAGFADFVQMSSCKGRVRIINSYFEGAHDDPVNIHGTHLVAVASDASDKLTVRYMHGQTYGFVPFIAGDSIEIVNRRTLNALSSAAVKDVKQLGNYDFELTLDRDIFPLPDGLVIDDLAVENITWTPEVEISNNYFARIPTRGILITTRGKSIIKDNVFFRMPMSAILVSDDARGWYESGPVRDLTICGNTFFECGSPVITVWPEVERFNAPVHRNITVEDNRFILGEGSVVVSVRESDSIIIRHNLFEIGDSDNAVSADSLVEVRNTSGFVMSDNHVEKRAGS